MHDWQGDTLYERKETSLRVGIYCFDHTYIYAHGASLWPSHPASASKALCCRGCSRRMLLPDSQQAGRGIPGLCRGAVVRMPESARTHCIYGLSEGTGFLPGHPRSCTGAGLCPASSPYLFQKCDGCGGRSGLKLQPAVHDAQRGTAAGRKGGIRLTILFPALCQGADSLFCLLPLILLLCGRHLCPQSRKLGQPDTELPVQ